MEDIHLEESENASNSEKYLERLSWTLVALGMLSQLSSDYSFPSYNIALGFWGAYCVFGKNKKAIIG